jgi:TonB-dependent starch-binding outer membrane protein SusC
MKKIVPFSTILLKIMKISVVQIAIFVIFSGMSMAFDGKAQEFLNRTITLKSEDTRLRKVLSMLEQQADVQFVYSSKAIKADRKVKLSVVNERLEAVLQKVLPPLQISYRIVEGQIILTPTSLKNDFDTQTGEVILKEESVEVAPAETPITGVVTDDAGVGLPGVSVMLKGTTKGTTTNASGDFSLNVPNNESVLIFSYVGYESQEVAVKNRTKISISLKPDTKALGEVVVLGYGTQSKRNITGSVATVRSEQIRQVPVMSPEQALQGRAAGVQIMQSNGAPGGAVQVQIRGVNSTNTGRNGPLYVLDGVPLFDAGGQVTAGNGGVSAPESNLGSPLATLNPNDIESIDVLKDASATAIYGARAANGVVVITTKSGKSGKTKFNLDYYYGVQQMINKIDMLNATEGIVVRNEALLNTVSDFNRFVYPEAFNPFTFNTSPTFKSMDWQNELFRTAAIQDLNLSASGGSEKIKYMTSANYFKQDGIFINTDMRRISARFNLDVNATNRLKFGLRSAVSNQSGNNVADNNPFQGTPLQALSTPSFVQAFNPDGSYFGPLIGSPFWTDFGRNPVFEAEKFLRPLDRNRISTNVFVEYEIIDGLKFKSLAGVDFTTLNQKNIQFAQARGPLFTVAGPDMAPTGHRIGYNNTQSVNWVLDQTLTYNRTIHEDHQIEALLGFSAQNFETRGFAGRADGALNPNLLLASSGGQNIVMSEGYAESGIVSQFARVNYNYKGRYLLTGTVRRDGSSNFGPANRYGIFPAVSVGWRVSDEPFMKNIGFLSDVKVRASHGLTGNQDIGSFGFLARMGGSNYTFGGSFVNGSAPNSLANDNLKWESNEKTDVGIDFSILKGRVSVTADYFINNSKNLLIGIQIPQFSGFSSQIANLGNIQNKGFELALNTQNLTGAFKWNTNFNISFVRNKVVDLGLTASGGPQETFGFAPAGAAAPVNVTRNGIPIGSFIGWRTNGIFQTDEETKGYPTWNNTITRAGDVKYVDTDGDGRITDLDREILGSPFPDFYGGLTNDLSYKNFSLNVFANFVHGNYIFNQSRLQREQFLNNAGGITNLERWQGPNTGNGSPRLTAGAQSQYNRLNSYRFLEDGSFLRIRNITLAYQIPTKALRSKIESLRLYASISNAFTFTKYQGWDPEVNSSGSNVLSGGIDQTGYPVARTFQVGFNLQF